MLPKTVLLIRMAMNMPLSKTHCDGCEECVNVCPTAGVRLNRDVYLMKVHG